MSAFPSLQRSARRPRLLLVLALLAALFAALSMMAPAGQAAPAGLSAADWAAIRAQLPAPTAPVQTGYLKATHVDRHDNFGHAVAVDGDTAVVGTPYEDSDGSSPADNSAPDAGAAYVFVRNGATWSQQAYLKPSNAQAGDRFGYTVAVDGDTILVSAPFEDGDGSSPDNNQQVCAGAAYVFVRSGTTWSQQAYLKAANPELNDLFGWSAALDGDTIVVGAVGEASNGSSMGDNSAPVAGAAYVFVRSGVTWSQQAYLKASNVGASDQFGETVAVDGDTLVVGAILEDSDGSSPDDNSAPEAGAAYVFARSGTTWSQQAYLKASNAETNDEFGSSVAVDGDTLVVGAYSESSDGSSPGDNSASFAGAAYVFVRSDATWSQQAYLKAADPKRGDQFSCALAIEGDTVVLGAHGRARPDDIDPFRAGAAYVFVRSGTTWSQQGDFFRATNAGAGDFFGSSVALDGDTLVVGALGEAGNGSSPDDNSVDFAGAAYVFDLSGASHDIFASAAAAGVTDDALAFGPHDILQWDGARWSKWFDGTAAGLTPNGSKKHHIAAFWIPDTAGPDVLLAFAHNARRLPGIAAKIDGMDLVWWDGNAFALWFDGQDVGLANLTNEKIDALHVLDGSLAPAPLTAAAGGSCLDYLLLSTQGPGKVANYSGGQIYFGGEDVLGFCLTQSGAATRGKWTLALDGSAEGMPANSTNGLSFSDDGQVMYLTTRKAFNVDAAVGNHSMVYRYDFATGAFSGPYFSAAGDGLHQKVDGLQVAGSLP